MNNPGNSTPFNSEQKFEALLDAAPDAVVITDEDGLIQLINRQAVSLFGYEKSELLGKPIEQLIPERYRQKHVGQRQTYTHHPKVRPMGAGLELYGLKKDGTEFIVEISLSPVHTPEGMLVSSAIRDATEKKMLEARLKQFNEELEQEVKAKTNELTRTLQQMKELNEELVQSRNIYKTIASSIPGSVLILFDTEYRYMLIEGDLMPAIGYDPRKLLHNKASEVLPESTFEALKQRLDRVFASEYFTLETNVNNVDLLTRYVPIRNDIGQVTMAMLVVLDTTQLKASERALAALNTSLEEKVQERTQQLEEANKELESFSYSVSHDLRAPLRIINGFADIMLSDFSNCLDAEGLRTIHVIMANARRMGELIDDLLNLSRMGRKALVLTLVNMNALVKEVITEQQLLITKPLQIVCDDLPHAKCDKRLMRQVWINLISNAVKYSSKKELPTVVITGMEQEDKVVYAIKDNGVGFDMRYADKLFGVFQRLHKDNEYEGTGVGLALVHKIITRHGGRIWAEAEVDKGAVFHFSLPATPTINNK